MTPASDRSGRGFSLVELMIVLALIGILVALVVPRMLESRASANETSAIGSLKTLGTAEAQFREADSDQDKIQDYAANLMELSTYSMIDNVLAGGVKSGYRFGLSGSTYDWRATAVPVNPNEGHRSFYMDTSGVIRFATAGVPDANSSPISQ